jgi:hypothetical protein
MTLMLKVVVQKLVALSGGLEIPEHDHSRTSTSWEELLSPTYQVSGRRIWQQNLSYEGVHNLCFKFQISHKPHRAAEFTAAEYDPILSPFDFQLKKMTKKCPVKCYLPLLNSDDF